MNGALGQQTIASPTSSVFRKNWHSGVASSDVEAALAVSSSLGRVQAGKLSTRLQELCKYVLGQCPIVDHRTICYTG